MLVFSVVPEPVSSGRVCLKRLVAAAIKDSIDAGKGEGDGHPCRMDA